jgi:hypothetical protein
MVGVPGMLGMLGTPGLLAGREKQQQQQQGVESRRGDIMYVCMYGLYCIVLL